MDAVTIMIYIFSVSFSMMTAALYFAYRRTGHYGMLLLGLTYGASAALAMAITHWWPLVTGFVLAWVLKLLGLDPGVDILPQGSTDRRQGAGEVTSEGKK